jgi:hypothetical protein
MKYKTVDGQQARTWEGGGKLEGENYALECMEE